MTEIAKPDNLGAGMSLDKALSIIEAADARIKNELSTCTRSPIKRSVTKNDIIASTCNRIGMTTAVATIGGLVMALSGFGGPEFFVAPAGVGLLALGADSVFPETMKKIISRKKWRTYTEENELTAAYDKLTAEEFSTKEKEILRKAKKALKVANKALAQQGQEIVYASGEGFTIKSAQPLHTSQWDKLRLETIKHQGIEAVGICPKVKELTA